MTFFIFFLAPMDVRQFMNCAWKHPSSTRRQSIFDHDTTGGCKVCRQNKSTWICTQCNVNACDICIQRWVDATMPSRPENAMTFSSGPFSAPAMTNVTSSFAPARFQPSASTPFGHIPPAPNPFNMPRNMAPPRPSLNFMDYDYTNPDGPMDRERPQTLGMDVDDTSMFGIDEK